MAPPHAQMHLSDSAVTVPFFFSTGNVKIHPLSAIKLQKPECHLGLLWGREQLKTKQKSLLSSLLCGSSLFLTLDPQKGSYGALLAHLNFLRTLELRGVRFMFSSLSLTHTWLHLRGFFFSYMPSGHLGCSVMQCFCVCTYVTFLILCVFNKKKALWSLTQHQGK